MKTGIDHAKINDCVLLAYLKAQCHLFICMFLGSRWTKLKKTILTQTALLTTSIFDIVAQITKAYPNAVVSVVKSTNNIGLEEVESPALMATSFEISESHSPTEQEYETEIPNELPAAASSNSVDNSPNIEDETVVDDPDWQPNYDEDPPEPEDDEITNEVPTNSNDITLGQARKSRKKI